VSTPAEIEKQLVDEISVILGLPPESVKVDEPLHTFGIDSLNLVEILVFIEKTYSLNLMESGLEQKDFKTIQSLARVIDQKLR